MRTARNAPVRSSASSGNTQLAPALEVRDRSQCRRGRRRECAARGRAGRRALRSTSARAARRPTPRRSSARSCRDRRCRSTRSDARPSAARRARARRDSAAMPSRRIPAWRSARDSPQDADGAAVRTNTSAVGVMRRSGRSVERSVNRRASRPGPPTIVPNGVGRARSPCSGTRPSSSPRGRSSHVADGELPGQRRGPAHERDAAPGRVPAASTARRRIDGQYHIRAGRAGRAGRLLLLRWLPFGERLEVCLDPSTRGRLLASPIRGGEPASTA